MKTKYYVMLILVTVILGLIGCGNTSSTENQANSKSVTQAIKSDVLSEPAITLSPKALETKEYYSAYSIDIQTEDGEISIPITEISYIYDSLFAEVDYSDEMQVDLLQFQLDRIGGVVVYNSEDIHYILLNYCCGVKNCRYILIAIEDNHMQYMQFEGSAVWMDCKVSPDNSKIAFRFSLSMGEEAYNSIIPVELTTMKVDTLVDVPAEYEYMITDYSWVDSGELDIQYEPEHAPPTPIPPTPTPIGIVPPKIEDDSIIEAYRAVLKSEKPLIYFFDHEKQTTLRDYENPIPGESVIVPIITRFAIVDLEQDNTPEVILDVSMNRRDNAYGSFILRYRDGNVYGFLMWYRAFNDLRAEEPFLLPVVHLLGAIIRCRSLRMI